MSSPLFSALEKLDESLQDVQIQVDWLRAGLEVSDEELRRGLEDVHQNALAVRELVLVERPNANWNDRAALEQLMHDLEKEAQIRLTEQRRSRLLDLANELNAGSVRHRFESRASSLNSLRLDAIRELRVTAALSTQDKEIPGPGASEWIHWACNLPEDSYSVVFTELRKDFPAVEGFAVEMEESYWTPGEGGENSASTNSAEPSSRKGGEPSGDWHNWQTPDVPVISDYRKPPHNVRVPSDAVAKSGGYAAAVALGYEAQSSAAPNLAETHWADEEAAAWQKPKAVEPSPEPEVVAAAPPVKVCEKCGTTYTNGFHACPVDQATLQMAAQTMPATKTEGSYPANGKNGSNGNGSAAISAEHLNAILDAAADAPSEVAEAEASVDESVAGGSHETAEKEFHRLRAIVEQRTQEALPREEEESIGLNLTKTQIIAIVVTFCALLAIVVSVIVHHYNAKSEAAEAAAAAATKVVPVLPDPEMQKQIELRLAGLKDSTIEVAVQSGVVTLTGRSASEEESVQAEDLALQTNGVKVVRDRIQVDGHSGSNGKPRAGKPAQR